MEPAAAHEAWGRGGGMPTQASTGAGPWSSLARGGLIPTLILVAVASGVVLLASRYLDHIVVYDEATHADYALRMAHGSLPGPGDTLDPTILREWACRGAAEGVTVPPCQADPFDPSQFPAAGLQYNFGHPPLYYLVTGVIARPVSSWLDISFVSAARAVGALWLAAGALLLHRVLLRWGIGPRRALGTALAAVTVPAIAFFSSFVTNDAAALLCGSAAALLALRGLEGRATWWDAFAIAALVTLTKVMFVAGLVAVMAIWAGRALRGPGDQRRGLSAPTAGLVAGVVAAYGAWTALLASRADPDYRNPVVGINTAPADGFPVGPIVRTLLDAWPPIPQDASLVPLLSPAQVTLWNNTTALVLAAAPLVALVWAALSDDRRVRLLSTGTALGILCVPVIVQTYAFVSTDQYFPSVASRYGLVTVPFLILLAITGVPRGRAGLLPWGMFTFGALALVTGLT